METQEVNELKEVLNNVVNANPNLQQFKLIEDNAEKEFKNGIKGYIHNKAYSDIEEGLDIVLKSNKIHSLLVIGEAGLGKSTIIKSILKEKKLNFAYFNSYTTNLSFYKNVFNNRNGIIVLDDLSNLIQEVRGMNIIKALLNTEKERLITYSSTSNLVDVPKQFLFTGKLIFLCNEPPKEIDNATLSRMVKKRLYLSIEEKLKMSEAILKEHYPELKKEEREEIIKFLKENINESVVNFSFRTILKIAEYYINLDNWEKHSIDEFEIDDEIALIHKIMDMEKSIRNKMWIENTGKSIRALQYKIKEIKKTKKRSTLKK